MNSGTDLSSWLLGILSILVSVVTFIITYRQTIGARKERAKNAAAEVRKLLYRNLIVEGSFPTLENLERILSAKVYEHSIKSTDLPDAADFIDFTYGRIVEDELIKSDQKEKLVQKVLGTLGSQAETSVSTIEFKTPIKKESWITIATAAFSIMIGLAVSMLVSAKIQSSDLFDSKYIIITAFTILGAVLSIILAQSVLKSKAGYNEPASSPTRSLRQDYLSLENAVEKHLQAGKYQISKDVRISKRNPNYRIDIQAVKAEKEYLIELAVFRKFVPSAILRRYKDLATVAKKNNKQAKLILITKGQLTDSIKNSSWLQDWDHIIDEQSIESIKSL